VIRVSHHLVDAISLDRLSQVGIWGFAFVAQAEINSHRNRLGGPETGERPASAKTAARHQTGEPESEIGPDDVLY
jgi:hypothetical protein